MKKRKALIRPLERDMKWVRLYMKGKLSNEELIRLVIQAMSDRGRK